MSRNKKWSTLKSRDLLKNTFLRVRDDELELPDGRVFPHYYVFDFADWVNVVPITKDKRIILVKQYRHAIEEYALEIPGGSTDPRKTEDPKQAALRELAEETGYVPGSIIQIGVQRPNPALMSNRLWSYVALDCEKKHDQHLDEFEDIEVVSHSIQEVLDLIKSGEINHSMVIAAIYLALPYLNGDTTKEASF